MTGQRAYLDWNATAPLLPEARAAMIAALDVVGNPSSVHTEGRAARRVIEDAREKVARLVGARPQDIVFTSGATEANNLVLSGPFDQIVVTAIEHPSVLEPARAAGVPVIELFCMPAGVTDLSGLPGDGQSAWAAQPLVSLGLANSETGVLQPVEGLIAGRPEHVRVHVDATQAVGRLAVDFSALGADYLTFSSHKLGGPKGAGALVLREGAPLNATLLGGGQERRRRSGTENIAAIAGFGAAAEVALNRLNAWANTAARRDQLEVALLEMVPGAKILGGDARRLPNTTCVSLPGRSAETLVAMLDLGGVAVSAGAACSSGKVGVSHVLAAMGVPGELARGAIRISLGPETGDADIALFFQALGNITRRVASAA